MLQERSNNCLFETRWDHNGKVRVLLPAGKSETQRHSEQAMFAMQEDQFGGFIAFIQAESSNAAYRIAQEHMLCIFMGQKDCEHIKLSNSQSVSHNSAK